MGESMIYGSSTEKEYSEDYDYLLKLLALGMPKSNFAECFYFK